MILLIHSLNELAHLISNGATGLLLLVAYPIRVVQKSWKCIPLSRFERFPGRFDMKPLIIFFNTKWEVGWHTPEIFMVIMQRPHKKKGSHIIIIRRNLYKLGHQNKKSGRGHSQTGGYVLTPSPFVVTFLKKWLCNKMVIWLTPSLPTTVHVVYV